MSNGDAHKPPLPPTNLPGSDVQRVNRIFVGQSNICEVTLGQEKFKPVGILKKPIGLFACIKIHCLKPYHSSPRHAQPVTGNNNLTLTIADVAAIQLYGRAKITSNSVTTI